ncbi:BrnT family toxin [Candidatus Chloroploca sp. M-50]|uniref:BrnT family toxin n=2 Tax=Candidatus Chloroploca mongolica TaxID=2528176 RepID=A0ABS4D9H6_9CHLR|nr:BrnT family toxin [Candidatus Chloroploca mongolica]
MKFAWDEQKNQSNMRKHGFSFADAWEIFAAPMLISLRKALSHERQTYEQAFGN